MVEAGERKEVGAVLYARVSSADQKADLDRQVARLAALAAENGMWVAKVVAEVGSGLNGRRKGLLAVLRSPDYGVVVVEHRDRLARFGSEYIEADLAATDRRVVVMGRHSILGGQLFIDLWPRGLKPLRSPQVGDVERRRTI